MTSSHQNQPFAALDSCHQQIQSHLTQLEALLQQLEQGRADAASRKVALEIAIFFDTVARQHHADEEESMFPGMVKRGNAERVAQIRSLIEDHFWIEKYSHDLTPMLRALGGSEVSVASAELIKVGRLFHELCQRHIEFEETMIYPQAKASSKA